MALRCHRSTTLTRCGAPNRRVPRGSSSRRDGSVRSRSAGWHITTSSSQPCAATNGASFCQRRAPMAWSGGKLYEMSSMRRAPPPAAEGTAKKGCGVPALTARGADMGERLELQEVGGEVRERGDVGVEPRPGGGAGQTRDEGRAAQQLASRPAQRGRGGLGPQTKEVYRTRPLGAPVFHLVRHVRVRGVGAGDRVRVKSPVHEQGAGEGAQEVEELAVEEGRLDAGDLREDSVRGQRDRPPRAV